MKKILFPAVMVGVVAAQSPAPLPGLPLLTDPPKAKVCLPNPEPIPDDPIDAAVVKIKEKLRYGGCDQEQVEEIMEVVQILADKAKAQQATPCKEGCGCKAE